MTDQSIDLVEARILTLRGRRVMLDSDLATLYGVSTSRFNEAVSRNRNRFPVDFAFIVTAEEFAALISQNAISSSGHGGRRKRPWVFTEHGAVMADLYRSIRPLLLPPPDPPSKPIGFGVRERRARYTTRQQGPMS